MKHVSMSGIGNFVVEQAMGGCLALALCVNHWVTHDFSVLLG
jgi:hypothetical protein